MVETLSLLLLAGAGLGLLTLFLFYPLLLLAAGRRRPPAPLPPPAEPPTVTLLTAVRNAEALIDAKIDNTLALDYPPERLELVVACDGSSDATAARVAARAGTRVRLVAAPAHLGKAAAINLALPVCRGELLVLSDADALLEPDALRHLLRPFADPRVGGVCGQRVLQREHSRLRTAQDSYIRADSLVKALESRLGRITANDGKLYAVRRHLLPAIAEGATDDLYAALTVVAAGYHFLFEPRARAAIRLPSRGAAHELARRRRVVCRSLTGIALRPALLDPRRYGLFALGLLINKVLRRLLPLLLLGLLAASAALAAGHPWARPLLAAQFAGYAAAALHPLLPATAPRSLRRVAELAFYFCIGNLGTLLGLWDFLRGRRVIRWDPVKDGQPT